MVAANRTFEEPGERGLISAGSRQLLVGPASSDVLEQMKSEPQRGPHRPGRNGTNRSPAAASFKGMNVAREPSGRTVHSFGCEPSTNDRLRRRTAGHYSTQAWSIGWLGHGSRFRAQSSRLWYRTSDPHSLSCGPGLSRGII
jgi:hypothetical protein